MSPYKPIEANKRANPAKKLARIAVNDYTNRVHIGLDYFDASINRVAAWTIGTRNMLRALCLAILEPYGRYQKLEREGNECEGFVEWIG